MPIAALDQRLAEAGDAPGPAAQIIARARPVALHPVLAEQGGGQIRQSGGLAPCIGGAQGLDKPVAPGERWGQHQRQAAETLHGGKTLQSRELGRQAGQATELPLQLYGILEQRAAEQFDLHGAAAIGEQDLVRMVGPMQQQDRTAPMRDRQGVGCVAVGGADPGADDRGVRIRRPEQGIRPC